MNPQLYIYISIAVCIIALSFLILDFGADKILRPDQHAAAALLSIFLGAIWPIIGCILLVICISYILNYIIKQIVRGLK
jgi:hypothetical protein